ncbi:BtrH N-terminal domain-containing protein [Candidatus Leptofilum sp.]|uniref:BtrH N-terminal domain-containing protein n=1 Tax=Candidatus Leptofilum sp. TaxID=3241576 RepID=UPI003B5CFD4C
MSMQNYTQFGGIHPETATMTNVLANQGFVSPHNGRPLSEAMVLGIAGGLGCGYILWEFKKHDAAILVMGFQNKWNYTTQFMQNFCDRVGVKADFLETGGAKTAAKHLGDALADGRFPIAWVDQEKLPYFYLRPMYSGCFGHFVTVFGEKDGRYLLDDRSQTPLSVDGNTFSEARKRIGSYKNRLLLLEANGSDFDLPAATMAGLEDCVDYLSQSSQTFALPVYKKWAKMMTDTKNKKGWPTVFKEKKGLYSTLRSLHEGIKLFGTAGGGLRNVYADFLGEASDILNQPKLEEAAELYHRVAVLWRNFADAVLPDEIPPLKETKTLLAKKYHIFLSCGTEADAELRQLSQQLQDMEVELNGRFPISDDTMQALFADMQGHLEQIYATEKEALAALAGAIS